MNYDVIDAEELCTAVVESQGDEEFAMAALQLLYKHGHPVALFALAMWALEGEYGVAIGPDECVEALERAADLGHAGSAYNLGIMYEIGKFVPLNDEMASRFYLLAAFRGHAKALDEIASSTGPAVAVLSMSTVRAVAGEEAQRLV
jgi:TPR repeat protein